MRYCKACNEIFSPRINKFTGEEEELCSSCLIIARLSAYNIDDVNILDADLELDFLDLDTDKLENR